MKLLFVYKCLLTALSFIGFIEYIQYAISRYSRVILHENILFS